MLKSPKIVQLNPQIPLHQRKAARILKELTPPSVREAVEKWKEEQKLKEEKK
jgi:hypothetical protein